MAEWIAIGITLLFSAFGLAKRYGSDETRMNNIESDLKRSFKQHAEHYQHADDDQKHFQNMEMHWTSRERDDLGKRMDNQDRKLDEIHKAINDLTQRMYGK